MRTTLTAFAATITGKLVLGTAIAAAGVGGAVAADVELPSQSQRPTLVETAEAPELPEQAVEGQEHASDPEQSPGVEGHGDGPSEDAFGADAEGDVPEAVQTFLGELEVWIACVQDGAAARGDQQSDPETRTHGPVCEDRPVNGQGDQAGGATPNEAAEQGQANADQGGANADQGQANAADHRGDGVETTEDEPAAENQTTADAGSDEADAGSGNAPVDTPAGGRP